MATPKTQSQLEKCTTPLKTNLYVTTNDPDNTSLIGQHKFFVDICGLQPIMNTPPWLQPIMDTTYPTGPNQ